MKRSLIILTAFAIFAMSSTANALWSVSETGMWPKSWPAELEPLRKQAQTYTGGSINKTFHAIHFSNRKEFEAAWPHLLKLKSQGAPIVLVRSPHKFIGKFKAGVLVHVPLPSAKPAPEKPIRGATNVTTRWLYTTYIELVVDGETVDLNRIALPKDTPIIDQRFDAKPKVVSRKRRPMPNPPTVPLPAASKK